MRKTITRGKHTYTIIKNPNGTYGVYDGNRGLKECKDTYIDAVRWRKQFVKHVFGY